MGLLSGLMGNASEVDNDDLEELLANTLIDGETVQKAYKVIRDMFIFTNKRLIIIDKQGRLLLGSAHSSVFAVVVGSACFDLEFRFGDYGRVEILDSGRMHDHELYHHPA